MLFLVLLRALLASRTALVVENVALRQQLAVLKRTVPRPRVRLRDRVLWVALRVNGQLMLVGADPAPFAQAPIAEVPQGFTVQPGATVDVIVTNGSTTDGVAWGYLAPQ